MSTWESVAFGGVGGVAASSVVGLCLAARLAERSNYGQANALARLDVARRAGELRDEFAQRAALAGTGGGFPPLAQFNASTFETEVARVVLSGRPFLSRRKRRELDSLLGRLVSESMIAVAAQLPLGDAYDETGQARFAASYSALAVIQARGSAPPPVIPPPAGALLPRSWNAPLVRANHDEAIALFDELLDLIDPRRRLGRSTLR